MGCTALAAQGAKCRATLPLLWQLRRGGVGLKRVAHLT